MQECEGKSKGKHQKPRKTRQHERPPYKRQNIKKPACVIWPDERPSTRNDKTGLVNSNLTVLYPVYVRTEPGGRKWHWLCECACGNEAIICNTGQTISCGCLREDAIKKAWATRRANKAAGVPPLKPRPSKAVPPPLIDRLKVCHRHSGQFECENYSNFLSAAGGEDGYEMCYVPDGSCYVPGREQIKLEDN